jgi:DNA-binding XRE family transcriptional regulator
MATKNISKFFEKEMGRITFGGFLRSARTMSGLSQTDMALLIGISKAGVCDIEKGRQFVSIELAARIAKKCKLSEAMAIKCAIADAIAKAGLKYMVTLKKTA